MFEHTKLSTFYTWMSGIFFFHAIYRLWAPPSLPYPFNGLGFMTSWYMTPRGPRATIVDSEWSLGMASFGISVIICLLLLAEVHAEGLKEQALSEIASNPT